MPGKQPRQSWHPQNMFFVPKCVRFRKRSSKLIWAGFFWLGFGIGTPSSHPHRGDFGPHRTLIAASGLRLLFGPPVFGRAHRSLIAPSAPPLIAPSSRQFCTLIAPSSLLLLFLSSSALPFFGELIATSSLFFVPPSSPPHRFFFGPFSEISQTCRIIPNFCQNPFTNELVAEPKWVFAPVSCNLHNSTKP